MKTTLTREFPLIGMVSLPFLYLAYLWEKLPNQVPLHWNLHGEIDRYGSKAELWIIPILLPLLTYIIMSLAPALDSKKGIDKMGNKYNNLKYLLVAFMSLLAMYIIYTAQNPEGMSSNFILVILGGLFVMLGNYFKTVRPNYFVGIRTPWTLENDGIWRSTHRLAGKIWIIGGFLIMIICSIFSSKISFIFFIAITSLITLIPLIHSYIAFQKLKE